MAAADRGMNLLVVEDNAGLRATLALEFGERGYQVVAVADLAGVQDTLNINFRFAVVDLRLGADHGLDVVVLIQRTHPGCRTVVLTGYGSIATAVAAVKAGAAQYLTKPAHPDLIERALWSDVLLPPDEAPSLARHEREYIEFVLEQCGQNVSQAARLLGIHRQSLQRKLRKLPP